MQRDHIEQIQQQMYERKAAQTATRRKKPAVAELPKVWCTNSMNNCVWWRAFWLIRDWWSIWLLMLMFHFV